MTEIEYVDYRPICERRGEEKDREDNPLLPDDASYTPLLERMDAPDEFQRISETDSRERLGWVLSCQQGEKTMGGLITDEGLRLESLPERTGRRREKTKQWNSSGRIAPNRWRHKGHTVDL